MKTSKWWCTFDYLLLAIAVVIVCCSYLYFTIKMTIYAGDYDLFAFIAYAKEMYAQGVFVPERWNHTPDIMSFSPSLFYALYFMITKDMLLAVKMGTITEFLLVASSLAYFLHGLGISKKGILLATLCFFGVRSIGSAKMVGAASTVYSNYHYTICFVLGYYAHRMNNIHGRIEIAFRYIVILLSFLVGIATDRVLLSLYLPLLLTHFSKLIGINGKASWYEIRIKGEVFSWFFAYVLGVFYRLFIIRTEEFGPTPSMDYNNIQGIDGIFRSLYNAFGGGLASTGLVPLTQGDVVGKTLTLAGLNVITLICFFFSCLICYCHIFLRILQEEITASGLY